MKFFIFLLSVLFSFSAFCDDLKIVSLAPNLTEIVYGLHLQQYLVGNTSQCDFPIEAKNIYKVGDYINPNTEKILYAKPNTVLATMGNPRSLLNKLKIFGVHVIEVVDPKTVKDLSQIIINISSELGHKSEGIVLSNKINLAAQKLQSQKQSKTKFLFVLQFNPIYSVSNETWIGNIFSIAGYKNIVGKSRISYPVVSNEYLIHNPPEVVFTGTNRLLTKNQNKEEVFIQLEKIFGHNVAQKIKIILIPNDIFVRPGPRVVDAMQFLKGLK